MAYTDCTHGSAQGDRSITRVARLDFVLSGKDTEELKWLHDVWNGPGRTWIEIRVEPGSRELQHQLDLHSSDAFITQ